MKQYKIKKGLIEDIEDVIYTWEESLKIHFETNELEDVSNLEDLANRILEKVKLHRSNTCTSALAFYKLKKAFTEIGIPHELRITPSTSLINILPSIRQRRKFASQLDKKMQCETKILYPHFILTIICIFSCFAFFITICHNWQIGLVGVLLSAATMNLLFNFSVHINYTDMRALANDLTYTNYLTIRGDNTVNYPELERLIKESLANTLNIESKNLKLYSF